MTPPVIDWAAKPEPWRTIGLAFRAQCEAIAAHTPPPPRPPRPPSIIMSRRLALGLSRWQLAERARCSAETIRRAEQGGRGVTSVMMDRVLWALDAAEVSPPERA
jgi:hypothetical protein